MTDTNAEAHSSDAILPNDLTADGLERALTSIDIPTCPAIVMQVLAEAERRCRPLVEVEAEVLNCTYPIVGALMVRNWGLPAMMSQAVRFHHEADVYSLPEGSLSAVGLALVAVTHVAEHLVAELLDEMDVEVGPLFDRACKHLGIVESDLEEFRDELQTAAAGTH